MAVNVTGQNGAAAPVGVISAGVTVTGNVACEGNLQISGRVEGEVRGGIVFVDETGVVEGAVDAEQLRVCGAVSGAITVKDLAVEPNGSVAGETTYERIKVASGGIVEGMLAHRPAPQAAEGEPPLKLVQPTVVSNPRHVFVD